MLKKDQYNQLPESLKDAIAKTKREHWGMFFDNEWSDEIGDLKCDKCGRICKTERGKNIHRASHKLYHYDPLEGQDTELWLRKNKLNEYKQSR